MGDKPVRQRSAVSGVTFTLGLLNLKADLVPAKATGVSGEEQFSMICEACETPTKPNQRYICPNEPDKHGPYTTGELHRRAKEVGDTLVEVPMAEIEAAKDTGIEEKTFAIGVYPATEVEAATLPSENVYRVRPSKDAKPAEVKLYRLLCELANDRSTALIGEVVVKKGSTKLARLGMFRGQMIAQLLIRPNDLADCDAIADAELSDKERSVAGQIVSGLMATFDPSEFRNQIRERLTSLVAAHADGTEIAEVIAVTPRAQQVDLGDALDAMLASIEGKAA